MVAMKILLTPKCFLVCAAVALAALADAQERGKIDNSPAGKTNGNTSMRQNKIGLVIHGGAGTMERGKMTPEREREYRAGIENALRAGWEILQHGGGRRDASEPAVR